MPNFLSWASHASLRILLKGKFILISPLNLSSSATSFLPSFFACWIIAIISLALGRTSLSDSAENTELQQNIDEEVTVDKHKLREQMKKDREMARDAAKELREAAEDEAAIDHCAE